MGIAFRNTKFNIKLRDFNIEYTLLMDKRHIKSKMRSIPSS